MYPRVTYSGQSDIGGTITTCESVWDNSGKNISGGQAGLSLEGGPGDVCFSGGGQSFCADMNEYHYVCANARVIEDAEIEFIWPPFDAPENTMGQEDEEAFYTKTSRDIKDEDDGAGRPGSGRGRAGYDMALYMNAYGICRQIDNTARGTRPLFMGANTEDEWRTVHGVPAGGNPNRAVEGGAGFNDYANDSSVPAPMKTCCAPVEIEVCGHRLPTGYAVVGDMASVSIRGGEMFAHARIQCVANNDWRTYAIAGVCSGDVGGDGGGGGGGGDGGNIGGYSNPDNGGTISASDAAAGGVPDGYSQDASVDNTNAQGAADQAAANDAKADQTAADNKAAAEAAKAEAEAAQAAADAADDSDSDS